MNLLPLQMLAVRYGNDYAADGNAALDVVISRYTCSCWHVCVCARACLCVTPRI